MRGLVFDGELKLARDLPDPALTEGEALIRVTKAGICNTDLELVAGMYGYQGILGHEFVGVVEEGPTEFVGQRIVGEISIICGQCDVCLRGIPSQCRNRDTLGIRRHPGVFADYARLPARNLHRVPDRIADEAAVFVEPLAAALNVTELVHVSPRDRVVVIGAGKLGLLICQALKLTGAEVVAVVRRERSAVLLEKWGVPAVTAEMLPDQRAQVVVEVTGTAEGLSEALRMVEPRGTVVLKSTYNGLPQVDMTQVAVREIRLVGSRCGPFDAALRLLAAGVVDVESMIDARYGLDEGVAAMAHAAQPGALKVLLEMG
ncbi:MAG: alcohol dehydrogenase catalytic domain-containing protein [Anaerolineae bacterium]|nr:alcohol dehydrogenase catalytic domain-containing protein [Anaerolineae bacterium]